jgi:hypothetical protein
MSTYLSLTFKRIKRAKRDALAAILNSCAIHFIRDELSSRASLALSSSSSDAGSDSFFSVSSSFITNIDVISYCTISSMKFFLSVFLVLNFVHSIIGVFLLLKHRALLPFSSAVPRAVSSPSYFSSFFLFTVDFSSLAPPMPNSTTIFEYS